MLVASVWKQKQSVSKTSRILKGADDGENPPTPKKWHLTSVMLCSFRLPDPWGWDQKNVPQCWYGITSLCCETSQKNTYLTMIWRWSPWFGSAQSGSAWFGLAKCGSLLHMWIQDDLTCLSPKFSVKISSCTWVNTVSCSAILSGICNSTKLLTFGTTFVVWQKSNGNATLHRIHSSHLNQDNYALHSLSLFRSKAPKPTTKTTYSVTTYLYD